MADVKRHVEALLFSSGRALSKDALASILDTDPAKITKSLNELKKEYEESETALKIYNEGETWKMLVRDRYIPTVQKVVADTELSRPTLETLAVIAYANPAVQSEVVDKRGGGAYDHIKELERAGFIAKKPAGRSYELKLTEKFFEYFDVEGEADIRELFKDVKEPEQPEEQQHLGDLDVVDVPDEDENPFEKRALGTKPEMTDEEKQRHEEFLKGVDDKLEDASSRNDEHEKEPIFEPGEFEPDEDDPDGSEDDETDESGEKKKSALDEPLDLERI